MNSTPSEWEATTMHTQPGAGNVVDLSLIDRDQIEYRRLLGELAQIVTALDRLTVSGGAVVIDTLAHRIEERTQCLVRLAARHGGVHHAA